MPAVPALRSAAARAAEGLGGSSVPLMDLCPGLMGATAPELPLAEEAETPAASGSSKRRALGEAGAEAPSPQGSAAAAGGAAA